MRKLNTTLETVRKYVKPRHLFETLDELATVRIANRIIDDAAYVTQDIEDFWQYTATACNTTLGDCFEFGVFEGKSINFLAKALGAHIHGFDSFEGLPSGEGVWKKYFEEKTFDRERKLPDVVDGVTLYPGWISETLPAFINSTPIRQAAFIHIDTDIYESAACIFSNLGPYIKRDSVLMFDEYCNYQGFYLHEYQAFMQFLKSAGLDYELISACSVGSKFGNFMKIAARIL